MGTALGAALGLALGVPPAAPLDALDLGVDPAAEVARVVGVGAGRSADDEAAAVPLSAFSLGTPRFTPPCLRSSSILHALLRAAWSFPSLNPFLES